MISRRWPNLLPLALIAALPFRIPIEVGETTANLLLPLYLVIAVGVIEALISRSRAREGVSVPRPLPLALAVVVFLYAVQTTYSSDAAEALKNIVFFYVPFALMFGLLLRAEWTPRLLRLALGVVLVEAFAFVLVGFWEFHARELLWNPKVINANQFTAYFRVNSVFWDPNIYGRFLAVAISLAVAALLWASSSRRALLLAGIAALLMGGLVLTFSQSSFAALLAGLAVLAALRWSTRWTLVAVAVVVAAGIAHAGGVGIDRGSPETLAEVTSGRSKLIEGGAELALERPVAGHGSGSFTRDFRRERKGGELAAVAASHTEPVTVAAEQGAIGLAAYLALIAIALLTLFRGLGKSIRVAERLAPKPVGGGREAEQPTVGVRVGIAAAFVALLVHTLAYAAFLTDPVSWALLAVGCALAPDREDG